MAKWQGTVRRVFTIPQLRDYVMNEVKMGSWRPSFVVVHNTDEPTKALYLSDWIHRKNWSPEIWDDNLSSYYAGQGWKAGPHFFVLPDGRVLAFSPMIQPGTHTPSWNSRSIGVETVGDYDHEDFDPLTKDTLVQTLSILHEKLGLIPEEFVLGVRGLHFHREDPKTSHKNCPGKNIVKQDLVAAVVAAMQDDNPGGHSHVPTDVSTAPPSSLMVDESNTSIKWVQERLNVWIAATKPGIAPLAVDGDIPKNGKTFKAVQVFQRYHRLKNVDGIPGPLTRAALRAFT